MQDVLTELLRGANLLGSETLSLNVREEHRLRVFENRVLKKKIFGCKEEEDGSW
jgi:hypothetical protein